jgi:hypothetical protein
MDKKRIIITLIFSLIVSFTNAQTKSIKTNYFNSYNLLDYKVISSNNSYVEIEYIPQYSDDLNFRNSVHNSSNFGKPDLGYRSFSLILPTNKNNSIEVIESRFTDKNNIEVKPVPTPKKSNNKLEFLYDYVPDNKIYSSNNFYPSNNINFIQNTKIRDKYFGSVQIFPVVYNPLSKSVRKYTYLRLRIRFGGNPILSKNQLSLQEQSFFNNIALNSPFANNWTTAERSNAKYTTVNSVLATGDFYKIEVKEDGIYKLDKSFLQKAGINVNNIDPRTIKIYGNGGKELPYDNLTPVTNDLGELKIFVEGENDGKFDDGDYILFYGNSPNWWTYSYSFKVYNHNINHYSTSNYYWITFGGINGSRVSINASGNYGNIQPLEGFTDKLFDEPEINNLGSTGTLWISQRIGIGESFTFNKSLLGLVNNSNIRYKLKLGNASGISAVFDFSDGTAYHVVNSVDPNYGGFAHINLKSIEDSYTLFPGNSSMNLVINLSSQLNTGNIDAYYDYLEVNYQRSFNSAQNNVLRFNSPDTNGIVEYQVSSFNTNDIKIFDVTNYNNVKIITPISYNTGIVRFQDEIFGGFSNINIKEYYVIGGNNYKTPLSISSRVHNQNIHGEEAGADFIIISPTEFLSAANRLKSYRESPGVSNPNYLKTYVYDINDIYNEFSGGLQDPVAMRNFLKYAYNNWQRKPVYVLFFGDGNYDYKNIYNLNVKNYIPPIEKPSDSNNELDSYPSDDFITSINESFTNPLPAQPDFYHGRLNINSLAEANLAIDKIINYESPDNFGIWKKKIMYVADDGWTTENNQGQDGNIHTEQCEEIAEAFTPKDFEKEKIYIVTYPTSITPQGRRKPGANIDIIKGWNEGRLVINYVGHGSTDLWAHEHIFVRDESIPQLHNSGKLPLVTIASCDLLRWDDPFAISAGEQLVIIPDGAINVIGANRPVYSPNNAAFNDALWSQFMYDKDTLNLPIRIGKAMYFCKLLLHPLQDNDMKFGLEGDPTVRISIPQYFTSIDSINNTSINDPFKLDTIKALQKIEIKGRILYTDSSFYNTYNGEITIKIFDVDKNITFYDFGYPFYFRLDGGTIFKGKTKIVNGKWSLRFIVPRDISYTKGNGKLTSYFTDRITEGTGYTNKFVLNGIDTNAIIDTTGPSVHIYIDSRNFRSGDMVNQNTKIIADLFDISGINLTGAIGHKLEGIFNDNDNSKIDLTPYYNSDTSYQYGSLEYPLQNLSDGNYKLKIRAWDTYNNLSESVVNFIVKSNSQLYVDKVFNYPNPFKDNTSFTFQHNLDATVNVRIKIYTIGGRLIKELLRTNITDKNVIIDWDGRDNDGDAIANGTYIYKVTIKSDDGIFNKTSTGVIAKLK